MGRTGGFLHLSWWIRAPGLIRCTINPLNNRQALNNHETRRTNPTKVTNSLPVLPVHVMGAEAPSRPRPPARPPRHETRNSGRSDAVEPGIHGVPVPRPRATPSPSDPQTPQAPSPRAPEPAGPEPAGPEPAGPEPAGSEPRTPKSQAPPTDPSSQGLPDGQVDEAARARGQAVDRERRQRALWVAEVADQEPEREEGADPG